MYRPLNKCLRLLERLGVYGTKKAGKNQPIKKVRKTNYDITRLLQLTIFLNNPKKLIHGKGLYNLNMYYFNSKRIFLKLSNLIKDGKELGKIVMS